MRVETGQAASGVVLPLLFQSNLSAALEHCPHFAHEVI